MSTRSISYRPTFLPGQTLNSNFALTQPPFDVTSLPKLFDQEEFQKITPNTVGSIKQDFQLVMDSHDKVKALGVNGSLDLTCGPVTGDANVEFAMNNINSGLSLSITYRVSHTGETQRVDLFDLNQLQLSKAVTIQILNDNLTFDQFVASYGKYVIIGFESGGEILYDCTYSTKSSEDKLSVAGGLSVAYKDTPGFSISGNVNGNYKNSDINKSLNVKTSYLINPSSDSDDQKNLLKALNQLTNISGGSDPETKTESESDKDDLATLKDKIDDAAHGILNPSDENGNVDLNWSKAIIYPIGSIPCVSAAFAIQAINAQSISGFLQHLNKLYIDIKSKSQDMEAMADKWPQEQQPKLFETYAVKFEQIIQLIGTFSDHSKLQEYGQKYNTYIQGDDDDDDDTKQESNEDDDNTKQIDIATNKFYQTNITLLNSEYNDDIFTPYNNYINTSSAVLNVLCDDIVTVNVSQDGGSSFATIIDNYESSPMHDAKWIVKTKGIESVSSKTVLQFVCKNTRGPGAFLASITYNGTKYATPDRYFECISNKDGDVGDVDQAVMYCFGYQNNHGFFSAVQSNPEIPENVLAVWPNFDKVADDAVADDATFQFKFSDIIST